MKKLVLSSITASLLLVSNANAFGFGEILSVASSVTGGGAANTKAVDTETILAEALKQVDMAKKLKAEADAIKAEMRSAISVTMGMVTSSNYVINCQTTALTNATSAEQAREVFNTGITNILNSKKNVTGTLDDQNSVIGMANGSVQSDINKLVDLQNKSNEELENSIKDIAATLEVLNASNSFLEQIAEDSTVASSKIDNAIDKFQDKGKTVALESVKMVGVLALQSASLSKTINNLASNPMNALTVLPKLKDMYSSISSVSSTLIDFKDDYYYIESKAESISKVAADASNSISIAKSSSAAFLKKIESIAHKKGELAENYAEMKENSSINAKKLAANMVEDVEFEDENEEKES